MREIGMQHLDGNVAVVLEIPREVDNRHPPRAELPLDAVPRSDGRSDGLKLLRHVRAPSSIGAR